MSELYYTYINNDRLPALYQELTIFPSPSTPSISAPVYGVSYNNVSSYLNTLETNWPIIYNVSSPQFRLRNSINGFRPESSELNDVFSEIEFDLNKVNNNVSQASDKIYFLNVSE